MAGEKLTDKVNGLPECPGVYTFKDARGKIIYVGKAKSLSSRVKSYFRDDQAMHPRTQALVKRARSLDYIATASEVEALVLECNLIKHFRPRYNVNLKDDKKYPYVKVTTREAFPSVAVTRNLGDKSARYFGPYTDAKAMRRSVKVLTEVFPIRTCKRTLPLREPDRGCLNYHIGRCLGPCRGDVTREAYRKVIREVCQFLSGRVSRLTRELKARMGDEAARRNFEEAARLRDRIAALETIAQRQTAVSSDARDRDVISVRADQSQAVAVVLKVREGKLVGKEVYRLSTEAQPSEEEILTAFLEQYAGIATDLAPEVVLESKPAEAALVEKWLLKGGRRVRIVSPRQGARRDLVRMAATNAQLALATAKGSRPAPRIANSIKELSRWLNLPALPVAIQAFDISTTQGVLPVGSRVAFKNGRPVKGLYRHYAIKTVEGQDDFAMMREVVGRSWAHVECGEESRPDLVLIDGGAGQVTSALQGMRDAGAGVGNLPPVVGIAKRLDEIYLPDRPEPVQIPHTSSALRLLQRIRDEAHRFAITYHRKLRTRAGTKSVLEGAVGVGPVLARRLLAQFGSLEALRKADATDLAAVKGMNARKAEAVIAALAALAGPEPPEAESHE